MADPAHDHPTKWANPHIALGSVGNPASEAEWKQN